MLSPIRRSLDRPPGSTVEVWVAIGCIPALALLAFAATSRTVAIMLVLVAIAFAGVVGVRHRWGATICLAPVFLLPVTVMTTLPAVGILHWRFILAVITAALATSYWRHGAGRPKLNPWSLGAVGFLFVALLALGEHNHVSLQESVSLPLFAYSGLIVGQCLLRHPASIRAIALLAVPLATLAILEALGLEDVWSTAFHANAHAAIAEAHNATRSIASFGHPLIAGACLMATGLILLSIRERLTTASGIICIVAAVTTVSRSALLGGALGITLFALQPRDHRIRTVAIATALALSIIAVVSLIPALQRSVENRVLGLNQSQLLHQESVRTHSLSIIKNEFDVDPGRLFIGGGVGYSTQLLTARGGNAAGYDIFDNEYITMMYDGGLFVVLVVFALLLMASIDASRVARRNALPALAALAVVMYFVDGMEWPSLSFVTWMAIGLFTTVPWMAPSGLLRVRDRTFATAT
jgi:hypothetical protein